MTVRQGGRVILMGSVGMEGGAELALPYLWIMRNDITVRGKWMYQRLAPGRIAALVCSIWATLQRPPFPWNKSPKPWHTQRRTVGRSG
jgi:hypothetical protein